LALLLLLALLRVGAANERNQRRKRGADENGCEAELIE
jgi:hypothetical protein